VIDLMELDPWYCDVIVERWQKFSGRHAERQEGSGAQGKKAC
jgi:DNA modification methylase